MTTRTGRPSCEPDASEAPAGTVIDGDLRAQWKAIVAMLRANRQDVVVVTVGPRASSGGRPS